MPNVTSVRATREAIANEEIDQAILSLRSAAGWFVLAKLDGRAMAASTYADNLETLFGDRPAVTS